MSKKTSTISFAKFLAIPEVLECFATSGEADFHLRVVVEDIDAYNAFLDDFVFRLPGVSQVRSNIVLKEIKTDTASALQDLN